MIEESARPASRLLLYLSSVLDPYFLSVYKGPRQSQGGRPVGAPRALGMSRAFIGVRVWGRAAVLRGFDLLVYVSTSPLWNVEGSMARPRRWHTEVVMRGADGCL